MSEVRRFVTVARQNGAWFESVDAKDYDALAARLDKLCDAAESLSEDNLKLKARLAEAERLLSVASQELLIGITDPTATCFPEIDAFLHGTTDSAPACKVLGKNCAAKEGLQGEWHCPVCNHSWFQET